MDLDVFGGVQMVENEIALRVCEVVVRRST
jgi:hypothetical protein